MDVMESKELYYSWWTIEGTGWLNRRTGEFLEEYQSAQLQLGLASPAPANNKWQPLPQDVYKMNFDAACFSDLMFSGFGAIIRNSDGRLWLPWQQKVLKYMKVLKQKHLPAGNLFSLEAGFSQLIVEGGLNVGKHGGPFFSHVREITDDMYWIEDTPPPAVDALYYDSIHLNE